MTPNINSINDISEADESFDKAILSISIESSNLTTKFYNTVSN